MMVNHEKIHPEISFVEFFKYLNNFRISHWIYSKLAKFHRIEKLLLHTNFIIRIIINKCLLLGKARVESNHQ